MIPIPLATEKFPTATHILHPKIRQEVSKVACHARRAQDLPATNAYYLVLACRARTIIISHPPAPAGTSQVELFRSACHERDTMSSLECGYS
jgi:hypothetical protein